MWLIISFAAVFFVGKGLRILLLRRLVGITSITLLIVLLFLRVLARDVLIQTLKWLDVCMLSILGSSLI